MTSLILLLAVIGQDRPEPETPGDRAKRMPLIERIMPRFEIPTAKKERSAEENAQREQQVQEFLGQIPQLKEQKARKLAAERAAVAAANRPQIRFQVMGRHGAAIKNLTIEQNAPKPQERDGEFDEAEPIAPIQVGFNLQQAVLEIENFDRWIFGDGFDEEGRLLRLQTKLSEKINQVMKTHDINKTQLQKLRLAGNGDIKRFLDRVQARRPEFEEARHNFNTGLALLQQLEPLSTEFQEGPFGNDSFFAKSLQKIESDAKGGLKDRH